MENVKASSTKIMTNYGVLLGIVSVLLNVVMYVTNNHLQPHWSVQVVGVILFIAIVVMALKAFKKENGGFMKLGQALKVGLGVSLIAAIIGAIYTFLLMTVIEPTYMEQVMEIQQEAMLEQDMPKEQMEAALAMSEKFSGPGIVITFQLIAGLFFGFIFSLISGLILKKENPYEDA